MADKNGLVKPERIVSLSPSNTEILFAIGAGDKVVAVTDHCNYPPELEAKIEKREITRVGGYWNPSIDSILELRPDLILVSTAQCKVKTNRCKTECNRRCELTLKMAEKFRSLGLNVLTLAPHSLDDVLTDILLVGKVTDNYTIAKEIVENLRQRIQKVVTKSKDVSFKPRIYFEVWNDPYISVNSKTWIGNLMDLAGGINIFGETVSEWPQVLPEDIIQKNPDIMVFPVIPGVPRFWDSFEAVKKRRGWEKIKAVRDDRLYEIPRDCISRPGPRLVEALELLEEIIN
jgi:iron complex transport system substrate-binding protein